ncbi:helix-turn-helix domain-containing protein [Gilvimarinus chinensis]|uniref:helix-turn-helix domain-containing protein n=1 Tax=Gilvimarinus chinensis TaxID=396005 RepID=UPI0012FA8049
MPDIAKRFGFSQRQLERRIVNTFGASPREYIIRLRTLVACELLRSRPPYPM